MSTAQTTTKTSKSANDVPQITWKNTERLLLAANTKPLSEVEACAVLGDVTRREVDYAVQALRFLGWSDMTRNQRKEWPLKLNAAGTLAATNKTQREEDVWDIISSWSPVENLLKNDEDAALKDLIAEGLSESTATRRLSTVKNWLKELNPDKTQQTTARQSNVRQYGAAQKRYEADVEVVTAKLPALAKQIFENRIAVDDLPEGTDVKVIAKARKHHGKFAKKVKSLWSGQCAVTGSKLMVFASHIKPWAASTGAEKTNPHNGLLLDERWDRLFDAGYVSFADDGKVMLHADVSKKEWIARGITGEERIRQPLSIETKAFLKVHRETVFKRTVK